MAHKPAEEPNDLEVLFVERANAGDVEGLVALYEEDATLDCGDGKRLVGVEQIRELFTRYLLSHSQFSPSMQAPALCRGNIALTSSLHSNGDISAEIARRQPDGNWLWAIDQFAVGRRLRASG
jgi:ketosteroid isomerase-like protein